MTRRSDAARPWSSTTGVLATRMVTRASPKSVMSSPSIPMARPKTKITIATSGRAPMSISMRWGCGASRLSCAAVVTRSLTRPRATLPRCVTQLRRDRPLGVLAKRETRDPEDRVLLLDPSRIGQHDARVSHQLQEIKVAHGVHEAKLGLRGHAGSQPELLQLFSSPWVHGEDEWLIDENHLQHVEELREDGRVVHVRGTMQRENGIAARRQAERLENPRRLGAVPMTDERIDHHVADQVDPLVRDPL